MKNIIILFCNHVNYNSVCMSMYNIVLLFCKHVVLYNVILVCKNVNIISFWPVCCLSFFDFRLLITT